VVISDYITPVMYASMSQYYNAGDDESVQSAYFIRFNGGKLTNQSTSTNHNGSWFNGKCKSISCYGNVYQSENGNWRMSFIEGKFSLWNFTQKNFRLLHLQIDITRVEYSVNNWKFHTTLGTAKGIASLNYSDGFGMEAKLVLLTVGAKGDIIGVNFDIVAVGITAKCQGGECEFGASALFGFTVSINVIELYYWITSKEGGHNDAYVN